MGSDKPENCIGNFGRMDKISSSRMLLKAVKDLEASLLKPYEEYPAKEPEHDFLNAIASVTFLSRIVFKDLVLRQGEQISANWAMTAAISLGDFQEASRFLDVEIADLVEQGQDLAKLEETVAMALKNHSRSERWQELLTQIENAKTV